MSETNNTKEKAVAVLGLDNTTDPAGREYDLVQSLLEAANYRNDDSLKREVEIRRNKKLLFTVHIHPLSDDDTRLAHKKATTYMKNPQGVKYPPIERETNSSLLNSWLIYLATDEEDRQRIWGNQKLKDAYGLSENVESVDVLLRYGEKSKLIDLISGLSGLADDDDESGNSVEESLAKN